MTAMPRSLSLLIACALLVAMSSAVRPTMAHATTPTSASAVGGQPSIGTGATPGTPAAIALTVEPSTIPCDGAHASTVTATVTDAAGAPVPDGVPVNFSVLTPGTVNPVNTVTKNGMASSVITPLSDSAAGTMTIVSSGSVQSQIRIDCAYALEHLGPVTLPPAPVGGQLSIGTPLGKSVTGSLVVPINTTAATDGYYGYAIHLEFDGSLIDAAGSDVTPTFGGSTLDAGGVPGFEAEVGALDSHSITAAAWKAGGQSTTLAGTMTHVWLTASCAGRIAQTAKRRTAWTSPAPRSARSSCRPTAHSSRSRENSLDAALTMSKWPFRPSAVAPRDTLLARTSR
jgi:hypothetical protein